MNKKVLFSTKCTMTPDKYGEMSKQFIGNILSGVFLVNIFLIIILLIFNLLIYKIPFAINVAFVVVVSIITFINLKYNIYNISKNNYIRRMIRLNLPLENEMIIDFYDDYLVQKGKPAIVELYYKEINTAVETDKNIYLKCSKYNVTVLIEKDKCSKELIEFIESKFFH